MDDCDIYQQPTERVISLENSQIDYLDVLAIWGRLTPDAQKKIIHSLEMEQEMTPL